MQLIGGEQVQAATGVVAGTDDQHLAVGTSRQPTRSLGRSGRR